MQCLLRDEEAEDNKYVSGLQSHLKQRGAISHKDPPDSSKNNSLYPLIRLQLVCHKGSMILMKSGTHARPRVG